MNNDFKCKGETDRSGLYIIIFIMFWNILNIRVDVKEIKDQVIPQDSTKTEQPDSLNLLEKLDKWHFETLGGK